jgi:hypothetical protein
MAPVRVLIVLAAALSASAAAAQTSFPPPPPGDDVLSLRIGDRVRVWSAAAAPLTAAIGIVNAPGEDGLALIINKRIRVVPFKDLRKLEVRRARRHARLGAVIGATVGAVTSLFLEDILDRDLDNWEWAAGVAAFTAGGAGLGAAVGHYVRTHRWVPLAVIPGPRPAPTPASPRRPGLSFSFRF